MINAPMVQQQRAPHIRAPQVSNIYMNDVRAWALKTRQNAEDSSDVKIDFSYLYVLDQPVSILLNLGTGHFLHWPVPFRTHFFVSPDCRDPRMLIP